MSQWVKPSHYTFSFDLSYNINVWCSFKELKKIIIFQSFSHFTKYILEKIKNFKYFYKYLQIAKKWFIHWLLVKCMFIKPWQICQRHQDKTSLCLHHFSFGKKKHPLFLLHRCKTWWILSFSPASTFCFEVFICAASMNGLTRHSRHSGVSLLRRNNRRRPEWVMA